MPVSSIPLTADYLFSISLKTIKLNYTAVLDSWVLFPNLSLFFFYKLGDFFASMERKTWQITFLLYCRSCNASCKWLLLLSSEGRQWHPSPRYRGCFRKARCKGQWRHQVSYSPWFCFVPWIVLCLLWLLIVSEGKSKHLRFVCDYNATYDWF